MKKLILLCLVVLLAAGGHACGKKSKDHIVIFPPPDAIEYWDLDDSVGDFIGMGPAVVSLEISSDSPYRGEGALKFTYTETDGEAHAVGLPLSLVDATSDIRVEFQVRVSHPGTYYVLLSEDGLYDYLASFHARTTGWEKVSLQSVQFFQNLDGGPVDPNHKLDGDGLTSLAIADPSGMLFFKDAGEKYICIDDLLILPDDGAPVAITDRTFFKNVTTGKIGFHPYPAFDDMMANNMLGALKNYVELGCQFGMDTVTWTEYETATAVYDFTRYELLNEYYDRNIPQYRQRTEFAYRVDIVNMHFREGVPTDLDGLDFDNATLISRYVDFVKAYLNAAGVAADQEFYFFVGNEVDTYFEANESEIDKFKTFYAQVKTDLKAQYPNMQIGVITKYHGTRQDIIASVNESSDVIAYTYYGHGANFSYANLEDLDTVFSGMVTSAGGKPVVITEIGFATADILNSNEDGQAAYIAEMFQKYPAYRDSIKAVLWFMQGDFGDDFLSYLMDQFFPAFKGYAEFEAYLQYLGLYHNDGTPKKAVSQWLWGMSWYYAYY